MDILAVKQCLGKLKFSNHSRLEMERESRGIIKVDEIVQALDVGEIIEEYPDDRPYASCLMLGRTAAGRPLHVVCAPVMDEAQLVVVTTYEPDPALWEPGFKRRKQS
ncbi:MAG: DUF4258 domain-containing protein [Candidatus Coatesbacteria bacterium]